MKPLVLVFVVVAAFLTAAAFTYVSKNFINDSVRPGSHLQKKQVSYGCAPAYHPTEDESIPALTGWGNYRWKITTVSDSAQFYFNQGINMYYAFHIIESRASFDKATLIDPLCAMAWWGKALAFGPNINDLYYERPPDAYSSAAKAMALKQGCTKTEQALINAMSVRYVTDSTKDQGGLNILYKEAMKEVYHSNIGNADVDALYADALMTLHPWDLYNKDYTAKEWTPELVTVLKKALLLSPRHPGANHYYVHAVEASAKPGDALKSAAFLETAMPAVSHLTHMPSHIYIRTGYYSKGIIANDKALEGFNKYLVLFPSTIENLPLYSLHNSHLKINCAQMAGNYGIAMDAANKLQHDFPAAYLSIPGGIGHMIRYMYYVPIINQVRFGKWKDILAARLDDTLQKVPIIQHFARGMGFARTNLISKAQNELGLMKDKMKEPSLKEPMVPFNSAFDVYTVAENILEGVIAEEQKAYDKAVLFFEKAVVADDQLIYNEPRDWLIPARQYLGNALLKAGKPVEAMAVFNKDLIINPNNGWDLTGLATAYSEMNKPAEMLAAKARARKAFNSDMIIKNAVF